MDFERYAKNNTRHLEAMMQGLARYIHSQASMGIEPMKVVQKAFGKLLLLFQNLKLSKNN